MEGTHITRDSDDGKRSIECDGDCTSGDECRLVTIHIDTIELVSKTATLQRPRALLHATT